MRTEIGKGRAVNISVYSWLFAVVSVQQKSNCSHKALVDKVVYTCTLYLYFKRVGVLM